MGNLFRSAHAFGARFVFTVDVACGRADARAGTSNTPGQVPLYQCADAASLDLARGCKLVGVELLGEAEALPSRCPGHAAGAPNRRKRKTAARRR